jgi:glycosyltransferase involved in cell wall biosynthesis
MSSLIKKNILVISPEAWGTSFVSKHHYALELAKRGNKVFFLNPPGGSRSLRLSKFGEQDKVSVIDYSPVLKGTNRLPFRVADVFSQLTIKKLLKVTGPLDVVWSFDPYRFQNLNLFKASYKVYHSMDYHHTPLELRAAQNADLVLGISRLILEKFQHLSVPQYKINHGLSESFLKPQDEEPKPLLSVQEKMIKVGYVGALTSSALDYKILLKLVRQNPEVFFCFIGPYEASNLIAKAENQKMIGELKQLSNVQLAGALPSYQLGSYLKNFDVLLMCYRASKKVGSNSHKLLEYLSTGKVVVSNYVDEYKDKRHLLEMVEENSDLPKQFQKVIANLSFYNTEEKQAERKAFALANTYSEQIEKIERIIQTIASHDESPVL